MYRKSWSHVSVEKLCKRPQKENSFLVDERPLGVGEGKERELRYGLR